MIGRMVLTGDENEAIAEAENEGSAVGRRDGSRCQDGDPLGGCGDERGGQAGVQSGGLGGGVDMGGVMEEETDMKEGVFDEDLDYYHYDENDLPGSDESGMRCVCM
jgi:hypothetical protein